MPSEITSGGLVSTESLGWDINFNAGYNFNRITELYNGVNEYENANTNTKLVVGHPLGDFYMNLFSGVNPANGDALWYDKDGNITNQLRDSDRVLLGKSYHAPWQGGFGTSLRWKRLTLSAQMSFVAGRYMVNNDRYFDESNGRFATYNQSRRLLDRWKQPGDVTDIRVTESSPNSTAASGGRFIHEAQEPDDRIFLPKVRLYAQAQNLFTLTGSPDSIRKGQATSMRRSTRLSRQFHIRLLRVQVLIR